MQHTAVIGAQWGDEGKGKIIDLLAKDHDIIVRCQGGNNAGHTVVVNGERYPFHLLPSAILHKDKTCVLGNGMVIDPVVLAGEINNLKNKVGTFAKILVSDRAHIIKKEHIEHDKIHGKSLGTTSRGIGPAYGDKIHRKGSRVHGLHLLDEFSPEIKNLLSPLVQDTGLFLHQQLQSGKRLLFEGAQATMLDVDHGLFPFVTSSNCTVGGLFTGSGVYVKDLKTIGVAKAYATCVGVRPFVTELLDVTGDTIRNRGKEFGTTTGRPRRCGWMDTVVVRYAKRINNLDTLALTKIDILSGLGELKICDAYEIDGTLVREVPADIEQLNRAKPHYITMPGWNEDISMCRTYDALPRATREYIEKIEEITGLKAEYIGVGPDRDRIIVR